MVDPVMIGNRIVFVQAQGSVVRDIGYKFDEDVYTGSDLTILATHLFRNHRIIDIDLAQLGGSALTDASLVVPDAKQTDFSDNQHNDSIPITYVPARNTIFLSYALALAEVTQSNAIVIGVNAVDYSGYPDCRPEYIEAFEKMANLASKAGVMGNHLHIATPLLHLSKAEIIKLGVSLGVDYALTVSCYRADSEGRACGHCDSCYLRQQGFLQAEIDDPTIYQ